MALAVAACGSPSTVDLASIGLAVEADIQAGSSLELAVPVPADTTIDVVVAPPGVTASIAELADTQSVMLRLRVDADTPRGAYNLALLVERDGEEHELGWPFEVVEPVGTATTVPGQVEAELIVHLPQAGAVVTSPLQLSGTSSTGMVGFLLAGGNDIVLAESTIEVVDGAFSATVWFENSCCTEMRLEVFQPSEGGLSLAIPLNYPESG